MRDRFMVKSKIREIKLINLPNHIVCFRFVACDYINLKENLVFFNDFLFFYENSHEEVFHQIIIISYQTCQVIVPTKLLRTFV